MAQPSVVREPSMEEILASIRRIIESNEPGAGKSISPSLPPVYAVSDDESDDDIHLTVDDDLAATEYADVAPVAAVSDPRFVAANTQAPAREPEAPVRTMSLADVAARVRAASERNIAQLNPPREAPQPRELPPAMAARFAEAQVQPIADVPLRNAIAEAPTPVVAPPAAAVLAEVVVAPVSAELPKPEEVKAEAAPQSAAPVLEPVAELPARQEAAERFPAAEQAESPVALISEVAGAQVARSFSELAAAVDGSQRRSLDEIAQEMLRPMLQEWLDDNLPVLVERLVREEIERVARGPRR